MSIPREQFIGEVRGLCDTYQPNDAVLERLGGLDLTTISAPSGMGKDAVIGVAGLPRVIADTIREPRVNKGVLEENGVEYMFRGSELDVVLGEVRTGDYVQIGMGPGRDSFYGSRIANYPANGPALMDVMTSQVNTMRELPFGSVEAAFMVAPSYEAWQQRLTARGALSVDEWAKRRREALCSLEDALGDEQYVFVLNDELSVASSALTALAVNREKDYRMSNLARNAANSIRLMLQG